MRIWAFRNLQRRGGAPGVLGIARGALADEVKLSWPTEAFHAFFLTFRRASEVVRFALQLQGRLRHWNRRNRRKLFDRVGIHIGEVFVEVDERTGKVRTVRGLEVDKCARVMSLGRADQILLSWNLPSRGGGLGWRVLP